MLEEKDDCIQGLVLRGCRDLPLDGKVGQEFFDLRPAHPAGVSELMEPDECNDPSYISLFGPVGIVQRSDLRADLIQQFHGLIIDSVIHAR